MTNSIAKRARNRSASSIVVGNKSQSCLTNVGSQQMKAESADAKRILASRRSYNTSQIVYGDYFETLYDRGIPTDHDAKTGEEVYERM